MDYKLITDNNRDEIIKMLMEGLDDVLVALHDSSENPISLSLYLLGIGITDASVETKLIQKTSEIVMRAKDPMKLTTTDFQKEFHKISPTITSPATVLYIVKWIGLKIPFIYPVAMNIE